MQATGADPDTAFAILINRNPDDTQDARAAIFVGSTFDDGNVPRGEQENIVSEALIPPLRDGDVYTGLTAGIDGLGSSIRNGPPQSAFEKWAAGVAGTGLSWTAAGLAVVTAAAVATLYRRRQRGQRAPVAPTTRRPANLPTALGAALAAGGPRAETAQGVVLALAGRGALTIEPEPEPNSGDDPSVQVRLWDHRLVDDPVERVVWTELEQRATGGVVDSKALQTMSRAAAEVRGVTRRQLQERRWLAPEALSTRRTLWGVGIVALVLAVGALVVAAVGGGPWWAFAATAALAAAGIAGLVAGGRYPLLTRAGQDVAVEWTAYREGLAQAARDPRALLDLEVALPDAVAMGLGSDFTDRLRDAGQGGRLPRCFRSADPAAYAGFPWLVAYSGAFRSPSSSGSGGTVSAGGAGGGGGAAGST